MKSAVKKTLKKKTVQKRAAKKEAGQKVAVQKGVRNRAKKPALKGIRIGPEVLSDWAQASELEWIETNGLGGWASSTVTGANTRRYHGLLVAATKPPVERWVLLSKLDESLSVQGESFDLSSNHYPDVVHPRGFLYLSSFGRDLFPVFEYKIGQYTLRKTIAAIDGENTTVVIYELDPEIGRDIGANIGSGPAELELRPLFAGRFYHTLDRANDRISPDAHFENSVLRYQAYDETPEVFLTVPGSRWQSEPNWYHHFELDRESERGQDAVEDLFNPGVLRLSLTPGERVGIVISTMAPGKQGNSTDAFALLDRERRRRQGLLRRVPSDDPMCRSLTLAADQFVVRRSDTLRTVIAGYPWFTDWGRDTMIALPGLTLVTRRFEEAKGILRAFASATSEGLLPNRFQDKGEEPEYNTVDASLWFFVAIHQYLQATGDESFVRRELWPVLEEIFSWHQSGTRHGIRQAEDGLLEAGEPGVQLTWMDAKVGDWVVTPRQGKPVEINALWYNALRILADLRERFGEKEQAADLNKQAKRVLARFRNVFWNESAGCLFDVVMDADPNNEQHDASVRPNQIFALSLPYPLLPKNKAERVLGVVEEQLLTPVGLRSLAPEDASYRGQYRGGPSERDAVYHQGTVWSWLLGPYITALVRQRGERGRKQARKILGDVAVHVERAGVGTISEIFDGEAPHRAHGCFAQAWSVAELLRAAIEDVGLGVVGADPKPSAKSSVALTKRRAKG